MAAKSYFETVYKVLSDEKSNILDKSFGEATKGIQDMVEKLVTKAGLPVEIADRYIGFAGDEWLLYSSDSYRDHFIHPFHTFLLGFFLLSNLKYSKDIKLSGNGNRQPDEQPLHTDDIFLKKWLLTSLWHDITYTAENGPSWLAGFIKENLKFNIKAIQDWGPILSDTENNEAIDQLSEYFIKKKKEHENYTVGEIKEKTLSFRTWLNKQITERGDHGVLSAILLLREAKNWKNKLDEDMLYDCALAIALHNYHMTLPSEVNGSAGDGPNNEARVSLIGQLEIQCYPLAFLLAYCDTIQEWGRPGKNDVKKYCDYKGMVVNAGQNEVVSQLEYFLSEYIKIKDKDNSQKIHNRDEASDYFNNKLVEREKNKFSKIQNAWIIKNWKYKIELVGIYIDKDNRNDRVGASYQLLSGDKK